MATYVALTCREKKIEIDLTTVRSIQLRYKCGGKDQRTILVEVGNKLYALVVDIDERRFLSCYVREDQWVISRPKRNWVTVGENRTPNNKRARRAS